MSGEGKGSKGGQPTLLLGNPTLSMMKIAVKTGLLCLDKAMLLSIGSGWVQCGTIGVHFLLCLLCVPVWLIEIFWGAIIIQTATVLVFERICYGQSR